MTGIQPGQRFVLYNGSGTWGHFEGEVTEATHRSVRYKLTDGKKQTEHKTSVENFQKFIDDGYVEMKE